MASWRILCGLALLSVSCLTGPLEPAGPVGPRSDLGIDQLDVGPSDASAKEDVGPAPDKGLARDAGNTVADLGGMDVGGVDAGAGMDAGLTEGSAGCGQTPGQNDRLWTLTHDGRTREFYVHFPPSYDQSSPTPLVFDFHGRLFTAALQIGLTGLRDVADAEGFIVVHPEGVGRTWNGGVCCGEASTSGVDDVGFVSAMIDELSASLCLDTRRVYATGMSNGGFLSHRLACELSGRIAAVAPVAGVLGIVNCSPGRAVPVFHFHGTADNIVGYNGIRGYLSVADSMEGWVARNGCGASSSVYFQQDDVSCEAWTNCQDGAEVRLCTIDDGGHTWPGGTPIPGLGRTTNTISASELMWGFFQMFELP